MRRAALLGAVLTALLLSIGGTGRADVRWRTSLSAALSEAKKTNRLVMVDFYTDWCGYCKKLEAETYPDPQVSQLLGQVVPVKLNAEKEGMQAARTYRVTGFPTLLFMNSEGRVENRIGGFLPAPQFAQALQQFFRAHTAYAALIAKVQANPNDIPSAARLAFLVARQEDSERAATLLTRVENAGAKGVQAQMPQLYAAVGGSFLDRNQPSRSMSYFRKSAKAARQPGEKATAGFGIAFSYLLQNKPAQAVSELKGVLAIKNLPSDLQERAQQLLTVIKQRSKS